jgi:hypothetical protein
MLLATSRETAAALQRQLVDARQRLWASKELVARAAALSAVAFHAAIPPTSAADRSEVRPADTVQTFAAVTELIAQVERSATHDVQTSARLIEEIMLAIGWVTDPSLVLGMLLEGLVETVLVRFPVPERRDTAIALCSLLWDRINESQAARPNGP